MKPAEFADALSALSFENAFNPYVERCVVHDRIDAPMKRIGALVEIMGVAARSETESIWVGRDLGHRGGRRTGLALTDDVHMIEHADRWGVTVERPTIGEPVVERTAAVVWNVLREIRASIFLWNVFPLHPHAINSPFSNRVHNSFERSVGEDFLAELIRFLNPNRIVAIGSDAADSASRVAGNRPVVRVRHPSYGGQTDFIRQVKLAYELRG